MAGIFLLEQHVGFHATNVGFPSISGCHAIVAQTSAGLFGYHALGGDRAEGNGYNKRAPAFAGYVRGHVTPANPCIGLYSAAFQGQRYARTDWDVAWRQEMQAYARALGYAGVIHGVNLSTLVTARGKASTSGEAAYVEFELGGGSITVYYKRASKMKDVGPAITVPTGDYMELMGGAIRPPSRAMTAQAIKKTFGNGGALHLLGNGGFVSFTPEA